MLEPAFHWARGDESIGFTKAWVCSNCDHLKFYIGDKLVAEVDPEQNRIRASALSAVRRRPRESGIPMGRSAD